MQVKILEEKILDGKDVFLKDEIRTVSDDTGTYFCSLGWAEDVSGAVATGERQKDGHVVLDTRGAVHTQTVTEA